MRTFWETQAVFVFAAPVAFCVIDAVTEAVCVLARAPTASWYTIATLFPLVLDWLIVHDCVPRPLSLMHFAVFVASALAATWTTAQLVVAQLNVFLPPAWATCTTGCVVLVQLQPLPGQRAPA
jgi:hypothetical protein